MSPRSYPVEFQHRVVDLAEAGCSIAQVAAELGISDQSISCDGGRRASPPAQTRD